VDELSQMTEDGLREGSSVLDITIKSRVFHSLRCGEEIAGGRVVSASRFLVHYPGPQPSRPQQRGTTQRPPNKSETVCMTVWETPDSSDALAIRPLSSATKDSTKVPRKQLVEKRNGPILEFKLWVA
jgi:hypothetical protein